MAYTLRQFCSEAHAALKSGQPVQAAIDEIALRLSGLLKEPDFVAHTFHAGQTPGKEVLFHDLELDFYVLAHVQEGGKRGTPHTHGESWAIYGAAAATTQMTEYRRVNAPNEEAAVLEITDAYALGPGDTKAYGPGVIHSTAHPHDAWVIRVTGTDLDQLPRYRFRKFRDTIIPRGQAEFEKPKEEHAG